MDPVAEVLTGPETSEQSFGQPGASFSSAAPATKRDVAGSTAAESADPRTQKGFNLSRSSSSLLRMVGSSSKKQAAMSRASQEGFRIRKASAGSGTGKRGVGHQTPELVLSEAESTTEWYQAIERKDCKTLMDLLRQQGESGLLLKTGKAGRTALHVAAIQGSLELVHTIRGFYPLVANKKQFPQQLRQAIDGRCGMKATHIAFKIVGYNSRELWNHNEDFMMGDETFTPDLELSAHEWLSNYELTRDVIKAIQQMITCVWKEWTDVGGYEGLMESFGQNVDYNFCNYEIYGHLFLFHHACSRVDGQEFVEDVINYCRGNDEERVLELMRLRDFQGRTPLHVVVAVAPDKGREQVLGNLFRCLGIDGENFSESWLYCGVRDGRGWTPLHLAATQPYLDIYSLFGKGTQYSRVRGARIGHYQPWRAVEESCTALHLAVLHNNVEFIELLTTDMTYVYKFEDVLSRDIYCAHTGPHIPFGKYWSNLSLGLLLGNEDIAEIFLSETRFRQGQGIEDGPSEAPIVCLAASLGNVEILRQVLNDMCGDPFKRDLVGQTCLHHAANGFIEPSNEFEGHSWKTMMKARQAYPYICAVDLPNVAWLDELYECLPQVKRVNKGYSGRKGCINMLLQAGVDIWQKDKNDKVATPGRRITDDDFVSWWHEKMAKEALDLRNDLNQGGNAISVIGALIATASYVGPLQPPLGYGSDPSMQISPTSDNIGYAHVWDPYVKIFMVSNSLSFYLAIASIMLAVVPSLPMPQQSLVNELGRTRKTVASAICILLLSVVGILVSYATASIAVMPNHTSFTNVCWTSYPALVGGFACLIGIVLFLNRVMQLMYPEKCRWFGKVLFNVWEETIGKVLVKVLNFTLDMVYNIYMVLWYLKIFKRRILR